MKRLTDPDALEETYRQTAAAYEPLPLARKEAVDTVARFVFETGRSPYGAVDMTLLEKIDKEGFVKALYAK